MTTIFLLFLFIIQMIGFYFLALLYTKVSKFDELEKKQQKLMREMDDAIAVYLNEIKDENDKLVEELTQRIQVEQKKDEFTEEPQMIKEDMTPNINLTIPAKTTLHHARQSYEAVKQHSSKEQEVQIDDRTRALQLHANGMAVEDIAKALGKGRTEIELILKFK